jgi:hypothetical protein
VPVFLEKFVLPLFAATVVLLAWTNPMGFDTTQRVTGALALIFAAYFVGHTVYKTSAKGSTAITSPISGPTTQPQSQTKTEPPKTAPTKPRINQKSEGANSPNIVGNNNTVTIIPPREPSPESQSGTAVIQMAPPYGNLAARCEELGKAIISAAEQRKKEQPDPVRHREEYKDWYRSNDGIFFHARIYPHVVKIHQELSAVHIDDARLDELIARHEQYFQARQRNVQAATDWPEGYHLSIDDIISIGELLRFLATQIPKH